MGARTRRRLPRAVLRGISSRSFTASRIEERSVSVLLIDSREWREKRDLLESEFAEARHTVGTVAGGNIRGLSLEQAESLQAKVYEVAAERWVADIEQALDEHKRRNGR